MDQSDAQTEVLEPQDNHHEQEHTQLADDPAFLSRMEVVKGKFPGQERIRYVRPTRSSLQRVDTGLLKATEETMAPEKGVSRAIYRAKRFLIGNPLSNEQAIHERLTKIKALAVLSSDVISSVAYATEAGMISLVAA